MKNVLLVCRGNLCRSPMAGAVTQLQLELALLAPHIRLCTAGTHAAARSLHADPRALAVLARHGYATPHLRARAIAPGDFERFDLLLAMDHSNLMALQRLCPPALQHKLQLFMQGAPQAPALDIPDPYFGSAAGFERVLRLCEMAAKGWVGRWGGVESEVSTGP